MSQVHALSEHALMDLISALPVRIRLQSHYDPQQNKRWYSYQVGEPTAERPWGKAVGADSDFRQIVLVALSIAITPEDAPVPRIYISCSFIHS